MPSSHCNGVTEASHTGVKLFVGSFNINASELEPHHVEKWLEGKEGAGIVALGFQECLHLPCTELPSPSPVQQRETRLRGPIDKDGDARFLNVVKSALPGMELIGDVSMGEPPTNEKLVPEGGDKATEWYGSTRLLVLINKERYPTPTVESIVVAAGSKPSMYATAHGDYPESRSTDKGGVALYIQDENLLLINCHLCGTNKYNVGEEMFDKERVEQLKAIGESIEELVALRSPRIVILGDLNFRVETQTEPKEAKARGGADFQNVHAIVAHTNACTSADLYTLFSNHDRLSLLLRGESFEPAPKLLAGCTDGLEMALRAGQFIKPTFTYKSMESPPRAYSDKRVPSWTDRILWKNVSPLSVSFTSVPEIVSSDHEPVKAIFEIESIRTQADDVNLHL